MKYAGLMKPPEMMTQDVYEFALSQVATNIVKALQEKIKSHKNYRGEQETRLSALSDSIVSLRESLREDGTRGLFNSYKDFSSLSTGYFGYGYASMHLKQRYFSGVKDPAKREQIRVVVEESIAKTEIELESYLSWGERETKKLKGEIKEFKKVIRVKLKPMKMGQVIIKEFPIYFVDWYLDQNSLEEHQEMMREKAKGQIVEYSQIIEKAKKKNNPEFEDLIENYEMMVESLKKSMSDMSRTWEYFDKIKVKIEVDATNSSWSFTKKEVTIAIPDYGKKILQSFDYHPTVRNVIRAVHTSVIHEMTHVGQSILTFVGKKITDNFRAYKNEAGMPSKKIQTPEYNQHGDPKSLSVRDKKELHYLDDGEFYTDLRDNIRTIMSDLKRFSEYETFTEKDKLEVFKALTGVGSKSKWTRSTSPNSFFHTLKRYAKGKYKKAVGEAYKMIFNTHQRMASRIARVHLERKKWVEAPPRQFDQDQQEQLWTIYDLSYSKVGKHISSKSDLMSNYDTFWVVDVEGDDEIDAFVSYSSTPFGKKIGLIGSDGTSEGRNAMLMKGAELLLKRGWYAEVDARFARLLKKRLGVNHVQDEDQVRTIINKPLEWDDDRKCYTRNLEGKGDVVKYLVGLPSI
jgi:hypothetical protein